MWLKKVIRTSVVGFLLLALLSSMSVLMLAQAKTTTITMWMYGPRAGRREGIKAQVMAFEQFRPNIKVNIQEEPWGKEKLYTLISAGDPPDGIVNCGDYLGEFWKMGIVEPLNSYIEQWQDYNRVPENFWDAVTFEEKIYGVPEYYSVQAFYYNKDHFAAVGLKGAPNTYPEMLEYAKKLTRDTTKDGRVNQWGIVLPLKVELPNLLRLYLMAWDKTAEYMKKQDGRNVVGFNTEECREAYKFFVELHTKHHVVPPDQPVIDEEMARAIFSGGNASMYATGYAYDLPFFQKSVKNLGVALVVAGPAPKGRRFGYFSPYAQIVFKDSKNKQAAWDFIKFAAIGVGADLNASKAGFFPFDKALGPKYAENPDAAVFIEEMAGGYVYAPSFEPSWSAAQKNIQEITEKALLGQVTPEEGFRKTIEYFQKEIDRVYGQ